MLNYTHAYASFALKAAIAPGVPHNDGSFTPVHVTAPEGSILNCREPAPVASRHVVGHFVPGVVLAALAPVLERHAAGSADALWISVWSPYNLTLFQSGGAGAWRRSRRPQLQRLPVRGRVRADRGVRDRRAARPARALAAHRLRRRRASGAAASGRRP